MTSLRFLEYQVSLLLAEFGEKAVLLVLAQKLGVSQENLDAILQQIGHQRSKPEKAKPRKQYPLERVLAQHPEKAEQLRRVAVRVQNRELLPSFRDIQRFFEQHSAKLGTADSRSKALPKLLNLIAELSIKELDELYQSGDHAGRSSLGIISDEILRREK